MARRDLSRDSSDHASDELQYILKKTSKRAASEAVPTVTAQEAMNEERVVQHVSDRNITRILFISQDLGLLDPTRQTLDGYLEISDIFDEVHIMVLRQGIKTSKPVMRPHKNVWIYTAATKRWWQMPGRARELLKEQLVFADGFRADLVVARDPFESALVAQWVGKTFGKTLQVHVLQNLYAANFNKQASWNWLRRIIAHFMIPKFSSVRTNTKRIKDAIAERYEIADLRQLPQLNPYESIAQMRQTLDLKKKYPNHVFNLLFVGKLHDASSVTMVIDAARFMLMNPRVALIIVGSGSLAKECEKRAKLLGIEKQVIVERRPVDIPQYLKAADLLLVSDDDKESDELVLKGAGAGIPMIMTDNEFREDIFTNMESAYIIPGRDVQALADGIHSMMNDYTLRHVMAEEAQRKIIQTFHQDQDEYQKDYRDSIEAAFFADDTAVNADKDSV